MKIVHISDLHLRNLQRHDEYRKVFANFYQELKNINPDLIINTGDTLHSKVNISPELVDLLIEHLTKTAEYAPYHLILGNHDLSLRNKNRQNLLSPVINSLGKNGEYLTKHSIELHPHSKLCFSAKENNTSFNFYNFSLLDNKFPQSDGYEKEHVNIGLFHGSIKGAKTDLDWVLQNSEEDLNLFQGLDYVLMGDIHKQQFFNNQRIAYAGSFIQQNFGEDINKGFLLWDIKNKQNFTVEPVYLSGARKFYTVSVNKDLVLQNHHLDLDSRIRIIPDRAINSSEANLLKVQAQEKYHAYEVVIADINDPVESIKDTKYQPEDLRQLNVQDKLIAEYLQDIPSEILNKVLEINKEIEKNLQEKDNVAARHVVWDLNSLSWNGLFQYGEKNTINFNNLPKLTGIFAANATGKSKFLDTINFSLFNKTTTGVSKNIHLINDDLSRAETDISLSVAEENYGITRSLQRLVKKNGKEESKGSYSFFRLDFGQPQEENGIDRNETDRLIQQKIGTFEDFCLTSLLAQKNIHDLVECKESKRKEILYRFLDLDIFEQKRELAKEDFKFWKNKAKEYDLKQFNAEQEEILIELSSLKEVEKAQKEVFSQEKHKLEKERTTYENLLKKRPKLDSQEIHYDAKRHVKNTVEIADIVKEIGNLTKEIDKLPIFTAKEELHKFIQEIKDLDLKYRVLQTEIKKDEENIKVLDTIPCGNKFPSCHFLVKSFTAQEKQPEKVAKLKEITWELSQKEEKKQGLERVFAASNRRQELLLALDILNLKLKVLEQEKDKLNDNKAKIDKNKEIIAQIGEFDDKIEKSRINLEKLKQVIVQEEKKLLETYRKISTVEFKLEEINKKITFAAEAQQNAIAYEYYNQSMGKDGISCIVLSRKLPLINQEIAKILGSGANFGLTIEYEAETQSILLYLIPHTGNKIRPLELASGAQRFLASLALRVALLRASSLPRCSTFIVDEGFGSLDANNLEGLNRIFSVLKTVFKHILVVSHIDALKDMVDMSLEINTQPNGQAYLEFN